MLWLGIGVLGIAWAINLPGVVQFLRLPGLNMLSHNRFVFVTSFAVLSLAALGLAQLEREPLERRPWFWAFVALLALYVGAYCWSVTHVDGFDVDEAQTSLYPRYPIGGSVADAVFYPVHILDRQLRPDVWRFEPVSD